MTVESRQTNGFCTRYIRQQLGVCVCVFFYQDCNTYQIFMNHWSKIHDRANIVVRMKHDGIKPDNIDMCTLYNIHFHISTSHEHSMVHTDCTECTHNVHPNMFVHVCMLCFLCGVFIFHDKIMVILGVFFFVVFFSEHPSTTHQHILLQRYHF